MPKDFSIKSLFNISDRVALVTGGSSGIGLMIATALASNGAKVYIVARDKEKLDVAVKEHGHGLKGQMVPLVADFTDKSALEGLIADIESREQCLCVLVNNAGVAPTDSGAQAKNVTGSDGKVEGDSAPALKANLFASEFDTWTDVYRTNVAAMYFTSIGFLPLLAKATEHHKGYSGTIINICSISGSTKQAQNHFSYNASKGAAIHLNKMLATELANHKIKVRVNALSPGVFPSEMTAGESDERNKSQLDKSKFDGIPAQRPGRDEDMMQTVLFMVTNQYLNGQNIDIDGGWMLVN